MKFDSGFISQVRSSTNILEVVLGYIQLRKSGQNHIGLCPFHNEKTPSFNVNESKQIFKCFGCHVGGDTIEFIRLIENMSFVESVTLLARRQAIPLPDSGKKTGKSSKSSDFTDFFRLMERAQEHFQGCFETDSSAQSYLEKRQIEEEAIRSFGLGYAPPGNTLLGILQLEGLSESTARKCGLIRKNAQGNIYDNFRGRIMFPIRNSAGRIIAFGGRGLGSVVPKYLNSPDTPLYKKSQNLFAFDLAKNEIRKRDCAILVEGYFDCIAPHQAGFKNVVAQLGTSLTMDQVQLLRRFTRQILLNYDTDSAGIKATIRSLQLFLSSGFRVNIVSLPEKSDPDTFIQGNGAEAYRQKLLNSQPGIEFALEHFLTQHRDPFGPKGKQEITDLIAPLLLAVDNRIERSEYISRVAARLQIEPGLILQQVRRVRPHRQKEIGSPAAPRLHPLPAEIVLVQALLDSELQPEALPRLNANLIEGLVSEQLLRKIRKIWELNAELSILTLRDQLEDAKDIDLLETISLQSPPGGITLESLLESIRSLQKLHLDKKKRRIQTDLKDKEKMDPCSDRIPELLKELEKIALYRIELDQR
jgi:DNA primase